ncbi:MAG TPA: Gfo/Idh/MocA family oxidoreductase [Chloroflexota bacterium]|jgi:predicted dehydrogenase|nr:Gfo/Idh/MocA family oxidoreductase [Chloroflexota bacterium]
MESRAAYRAGIIGTARVGSWYDDLLGDTPELIPSSHAGCYSAHPRTRVAAGSDLDRERLDAFGERWGVAPESRYTDFREMLGRESLDLVSVTTAWGHDHAAIAPVVIDAGVRGVFCEKPIATSMAEADRIVAALRRRDDPARPVRFACAYLRRWNPRYHALRAALDAGCIGELRSITGIGVGNLMHTASHYVDIMAYLAGDAPPAFAWGRIEPIPPDAKSPTARVDPQGCGYVELQNGVRLFLEGTSGGAVTFLLSGSAGRLLVINDARDAQLWRQPAGAGERSGRWLAPETLPLPAQERSPVLLAVEDLVSCLESGAEPACSERHAALAMEYCLALHASHRRGGSRVAFPLEDRELSVDTW